MFYTNNIVVNFELLDISPIVGNIQKASSYKETALAFAANTITQMIQNGDFAISLSGTEFKNVSSAEYYYFLTYTIGRPKENTLLQK